MVEGFWAYGSFLAWLGSGLRVVAHHSGFSGLRVQKAWGSRFFFRLWGLGFARHRGFWADSIHGWQETFDVFRAFRALTVLRPWGLDFCTASRAFSAEGFFMVEGSRL